MLQITKGSLLRLCLKNPNYFFIFMLKSKIYTSQMKFRYQKLSPLLPKITAFTAGSGAAAPQYAMRFQV
jgi:hypothetical protein